MDECILCEQTLVYLGFLFLPISICDYLQINLINLSLYHVTWCHSIKRFNVNNETYIELIMETKMQQYSNTNRGQEV